MGKRKIVRKQAEPSTAPTSPKREEENPTPPPPPAPQPQHVSIIPANALEMILRATNPNIDWTATLATLGQLAGTVTASTPTVQTASVKVETAPMKTALSETSTETAGIATTEPSPPESSRDVDRQGSPTKTLVVPLDISRLSAYKLPDKITDGREEDKAEKTVVAAREPERRSEKGDTEEGKEQEENEKKKGEKSEEKMLNETAKKQGLMIDEEFEALLEGAQGVGQEAARVAEGLDLAPPVTEKEILPSEPVHVPSQSEGKVEVEEPGTVPVIPETEVEEKKATTKATKRKLTLADDTAVEERTTRSSRSV